MKRIVLALVTSIMFSCLPKEIKATHLWGGEIYWECLSNGYFVFHMTVYRDCSGANLNFVNQTLSVSGNTLPLSTNNAPISSIIVKPDTNRWYNLSSGSIEQDCHDPNLKLNCVNGDVGALQYFFFKSNWIQLKGTPSSNGWTFFWSGNSRPNVQNLMNGPLGLRATMYPILNPAGSPQYLTTDLCDDSSPRFGALPEPAFCRGLTIDYNNQVVDAELDSLVYSFDEPLGGSVTTVLNFNNGFSKNAPLPGISAHVNNNSGSIDPNSGQMTASVNNGTGRASYVTVVRTDAYRDGQKIASVFRDIPFQFFDCSPLTSAMANNSPSYSLNGTNSNFYQAFASAGSKIQIPIQTSDNDLDQSRTPPFQSVKLKMVSELFSNNFVDSSLCNYPPCATLTNSTPILDSASGEYVIISPSGLSTMFSWQTDSSHLGRNFSPKSYFFTFKSSDDHCPVSAVSYATIEVIVTANSVGLDEKMNVQSGYVIFPNPSSKIFNISSSNQEIIREIRVFNLNGQLLQLSNPQKNKTSLLIDEPNGIYFLEIENENGEVHQEKVLKY